MHVDQWFFIEGTHTQNELKANFLHIIKDGTLPKIDDVLRHVYYSYPSALNKTKTLTKPKDTIKWEENGEHL